MAGAFDRDSSSIASGVLLASRAGRKDLNSVRPRTRLPLLPALLNASAPCRDARSERPRCYLRCLALTAAGWWASTAHRFDRTAPRAQVAGDASAAFAQHAARRSPASGDELGRCSRRRSRARLDEPQPPAPAAATRRRPADRSRRRRSRSGQAHCDTRNRARQSRRRPLRRDVAHREIARWARSAHLQASRARAGSRPRIELTADTVEVEPSDPAAHVMVKRTGNLHWRRYQLYLVDRVRDRQAGSGLRDRQGPRGTLRGRQSPADQLVRARGHGLRHASSPKSFYVVINDPSEPGPPWASARSPW